MAKNSASQMRMVPTATPIAKVRIIQRRSCTMSLARMARKAELPDNAYDTRFVRHPWLTYLHIAPGALCMVGGTVHLAYWFRSPALHSALADGENPDGTRAGN